MKKQLLSLALLLIASALFATDLPAPEKDEMTMTELNTQLFNLDGKVIETEITSVSNFEQIAPGKYRAFCRYYKGSSGGSSESVLILEEGKEFFEKLAKKGYFSSSSKTVYFLVHSSKPIYVKNSFPMKLEAVGTRFKKSKGTYSW